MGQLYECGGVGVSQDFGKARRLYEQALQHKPFALALLALGGIYYFGRGVEEDMSVAQHYYEQLEEDNAVANLMLGKIYYFQKSDLDSARKYFQRSEELGNLIASKHLSQLDLQEGRLMSGVIRGIAAIAKIFWAIIRRPHDIHLNTS